MIEWVDSHGSTTGWKFLEDMTPDRLIARSVGWLLHETDTVKVIIPHMVQPDPETRIAAQGRGDMTIPNEAIIQLWDLQIPKFSQPTTDTPSPP